MGTRAVVRADIRPFDYGKDIFIATHWDGDPEYLGESLRDALKNEVETEVKRKEGRDEPRFDLGGIVQRAVFKGAAEHHIDKVTTIGEDDFDDYGDFAAYYYKITPEGLIKWTDEHEIPWDGVPEDVEWNIVENTKELSEWFEAMKEGNQKKLEEEVL